MSRYQLATGSENISIRQEAIPRIGTAGYERRAERPLRVGIGAAHDQHGGADNHEREQRADVGQVQQRIDGQEAGHRRHEDADQNRGFPRGPEPGVHVAEEIRRHECRRVPSRGTHAARASIMHEQHGCDAGHAGSGDDELGPRQAGLLEGVRNAGASTLRLSYAHHPGEHGDDGNVEDRADEQRGDDPDGHVPLRVLAPLRRGSDTESNPM